MRRSKSVALRSTEAARTVSGVTGSARARNGFSETVYESECEVLVLDHLVVCERQRGLCVRTIVCEQRLRSTSQVRTVESNPQLTASFPPPANSTADTRAVCERSTAEGAFVLITPSPPSCTFRRFLRSGAAFASSGTSSTSGMLVDHSPTSPSQPAVRILCPSGLDATSATGASCKCNVASGVEVVRVPSSDRREICAVRSCEALTTRRSSSGGTSGCECTMAKDVMGAACKGAV